MLTTLVTEKRIYSDLAYTHDHDYAQLIWPLQGVLHLETAAQQTDLNTADAFFYLPPHCTHTFYASQNNECLVFDIPAVQTLHTRPHIEPLNERWQAIRYLLLNEGQPTAGTEHLLQYLFAQLTTSTRPRSLQFMHDHFDRPLTISELAQVEGYNPTYYATWFKQQTGHTVNNYLWQLRLHRAKELLQHTDDSLLDIALQIGYQHQTSLTRLFQQAEGISPLAYRQQTRRLAKSA